MLDVLELVECSFLFFFIFCFRRAVKESEVDGDDRGGMR